jgi:hypothetical protein
MYDLVISGGDSFTFGAELETDDGFNPNQRSWANLVATRIGKQHINVARSGRSNSYITRHVLHQLESALSSGVAPDNIYVQVMWTFADRNEFAIGIPTTEFDSPWLYLTPYSHVDETESDWFKKLDRSVPNWRGVYNSLKSVYNRNRELGIIDFAKTYNRLVQSSPLNDSYTSLKEILLLQNTLKSYNIKYLFSYVNSYVMTGIFEEEKQNKYLSSMRNLIDLTNWYSFPVPGCQHAGFDDWAKHNNYEYATSHPLEAAHNDAATLVYNHLVKNFYYIDNGCAQ